MKINSDGRMTGGTVLDDVESRITNTDMKRVYRRISRKAKRPEAYESPEVIRGGGRHGCIRRDPGYLDHITVDYTRKGFVIRSTRPYIPKLDRNWLLQNEQDLADHLLPDIKVTRRKNRGN
jgi:hypothetical protein